MAAPDGLNPPPRPRATRLQVTVWVDAGAGWQARAEWGDHEQRAFDSPFELARFMAQLPPPTSPPGQGGLR